MKKLAHILFAAALFLPSATYLLGGRVLASDGCVFEESLRGLKGVQSNLTGDYFADIKNELDARKRILRSIVNCAINEAETLKNSVNSAQVADSNAKDVQVRLSAKFDETTDYYRLQGSRIDDLGLEGSKNFAKSLRDWRNSNYAPLSGDAANFIIWTKNQDIVQTARNRYGQINQTLVLLKLDNDIAIQNILRKADVNLNAALDSNSQARDSLERLGPPDESLALIKQTLESLAETYQNFFDITSALKR